MQKIRTIYMSTPEFGIPCLQAIAANPGFEIVLVVTRPDKPAGRNRTLLPPPIKIEAGKIGLRIVQPENILDGYKQIAILKPDLVVTCAYGQLLPAKILALPKFGCLNVHASLLPKYRGASPISAAILNGDAKTGITIMKMDPGLDTGPIISQNEIPISPEDTAGTLSKKLSDSAPVLLLPSIEKYISGKLQPAKQNDRQATYARAIKKSDAKINWGVGSDSISRHIRAMNPWPAAFTKVSYTVKRKKIDYNIKILQARDDLPKIETYKIGEVFEYEGFPAVQCGKGALRLITVQAENKKAVSGQDFLNGHRDIIGKILH